MEGKAAQASHEIADVGDQEHAVVSLCQAAVYASDCQSHEGQVGEGVDNLC